MRKQSSAGAGAAVQSAEASQTAVRETVLDLIYTNIRSKAGEHHDLDRVGPAHEIGKEAGLPQPGLTCMTPPYGKQFPDVVPAVMVADPEIEQLPSAFRW